jgi:predicted dehydrogenase
VRALLGRPEAVTGFRGVFVKEYPVPDDNAIIVMKYPRALGVAEASWTQVTGYAGPNPVAYGTGGSLAVSGSKITMQRPTQEVETFEAPPMQAPLRSGPEYLLHCLQTGEPIAGFCSAQVGRDAQEILEAGKRAADTGETVRLPVA